MTCTVLFETNLTGAELDEKEKRSPVVQTESGAVVGKIETLPYGKSVHKYLGIPYAEPPVGELRFAAPKPAKPWSGIKDTTEFGAVCPQLDIPIDGWNITGSGMSTIFVSVIFCISSKCKYKVYLLGHSSSKRKGIYL